ARGAMGALSAFQRHAALVRLIGALLAIPLTFAYLSWSGGPSGLTLAAISVAMGVGVYFTASLFFQGALLVAYEQQVKALLPEILFRPALFLVGILVAVALGWALTAEVLFFYFVLVNGAALLLVTYFARQEIGRLDATPDPSDRKVWNKSAPPWIVTALVWDFFIEFHILIASFIAKPAEVAILHICFRLRMLAGFGMRSLYSLFLPDIYARHENGEDVSAKIRRMQVIGTLYGLAVMGGFFLIGEALLSLFGQSFADAWLVLLIVSSVIIARGVFGPAPQLMAMYGMHVPPSIVMGAALLVSLAAAPFAYSEWGIAGIAGCYAVSSILGSAILWLWLLIATRTGKASKADEASAAG
ncbi:MAG: hypothetical protein AAGE61_16895, partial [Pseudomonadota bacterium]